MKLIITKVFTHHETYCRLISSQINLDYLYVYTGFAKKYKSLTNDNCEYNFIEIDPLFLILSRDVILRFFQRK